jgi:hypothetical protein
MSTGDVIGVVLCDGLLVLGAYANPEHARIHARLITGASFVLVRLHERLPSNVLDELTRDFDDDDDTPVVDMSPMMSMVVQVALDDID